MADAFWPFCSATKLLNNETAAREEKRMMQVMKVLCYEKLSEEVKSERLEVGQRVMQTFFTFRISDPARAVGASTEI